MTAVAGYGGARANWFGSTAKRSRFKAKAKVRVKAKARAAQTKRPPTSEVTRKGRPTGLSKGKQRKGAGRWTKDTKGRFSGSIKTGG